MCNILLNNDTLHISGTTIQLQMYLNNSAVSRVSRAKVESDLRIPHKILSNNTKLVKYLIPISLRQDTRSSFITAMTC
jgi:hypothetical protein